MRGVAGVPLVVLSGCRAIFGLEAPARQHDAGVDSRPEGAPPDARESCMDKWLAGRPELSPPQKFVEINSAATDATPVGTDFVVTWTSDRAGPGTVGGLDIALRPGIGQPWTAPTVVGSVNSVEAHLEPRGY